MSNDEDLPPATCHLQPLPGLSSPVQSATIDGMIFSFVSESAEATRRWGEQLGARLQPPVVVALYGDLGAGKTVLTKGIASGLGVHAPVTSPTFTLINEYDLPNSDVLYHVDCYRLDEPVGDAIGLGLEALFAHGVVVIEWADLIQPLLPPDRLDIELADAGRGRRLVAATIQGALSLQLPPPPRSA